MLFFGDALHAMSPYLGQGANSALADAEFIATHLGDVDAGKCKAIEHKLVAQRSAIVRRSHETTLLYHSPQVLDQEYLFKRKGWK